MCGICGQFNFRTDEPVIPATIARMAASIAHRGPDDEGSFLDGTLGLGFRRLSILDLSPAGHQPMSDPAEKVWVVFNGEIYNFLDLRREMEGLGVVFRSQCDTEVIVHGYRLWGQELLPRLNGMFGLAIWDVAHRRLTIARDALGIKPVYYAERDGRLFFGSELRAVFTGLAERPQVDPAAVNLFLRYRYTPAPLTMFRGVRKLCAGEKLVVEGGRLRAERWYRHRPAAWPAGTTPAAAAEELLDIYKRAIKRHLLSDVPLGLLLSGGIDSGLLLGLMSLYGNDWPTFTVGYGRKFADDELDDAAATARIFQSRNATVMLDRAEFERALPKVVSILEEPVASSSIVPMYFLAQRAREDVKVALMGQGPDELFGGYKRHLGVRYGSRFRALPRWLRGTIASGIRRLPRNETLKRAGYSLSVEDPLQRFQQVFSLMPGIDIDRLFRDGLLARGQSAATPEGWIPLAEEMEGMDELNGFQLLELRSSLPDELLMYGDKLSMVHGLEVRVPYLDREVVEYAQRIPADLKIRRGTQKWLHRRVCANFLPPSIINRKKRGFAVNVVDEWFQSSIDGRIVDYIDDPASLMYGLLDPTAVSGLLADHRSRRADNHKMLFSLIVLEQWLRSAAA